MLDAIRQVERSAHSNIKQEIIDGTLSQLDAITPDMDDFGSDPLASYVLNACAAVHNSIEFISDKQARHIFDIGTCLTDTIYFKVQDEQALAEEEIDISPLKIEARRFLFDKFK